MASSLLGHGCSGAGALNVRGRLQTWDVSVRTGPGLQYLRVFHFAGALVTADLPRIAVPRVENRSE